MSSEHEQRGKTHLNDARKSLQDSTGETKAQRAADAVKEAVKTAASK